jgi:hypothetical protein
LGDAATAAGSDVCHMQAVLLLLLLLLLLEFLLDCSIL